MVDDLLDVARIKRGRIDLRIETAMLDMLAPSEEVKGTLSRLRS